MEFASSSGATAAAKVYHIPQQTISDWLNNPPLKLLSGGHCLRGGASGPLCKVPAKAGLVQTRSRSGGSDRQSMVHASVESTCRRRGF